MTTYFHCFPAKNTRFLRNSNASFPVFVGWICQLAQKFSINLSTHHDKALCKQTLSFDDGKKVSPAENASQGLQLRHGLSFSDIAKCAKCFRQEAKKRQSQSTAKAAPKW